MSSSLFNRHFIPPIKIQAEINFTSSPVDAISFQSHVSVGAIKHQLSNEFLTNTWHLMRNCPPPISFSPRPRLPGPFLFQVSPSKIQQELPAPLPPGWASWIQFTQRQLGWWGSCNRELRALLFKSGNQVSGRQ